MNKIALAVIGLLVIIAGIVASSALFTVNQMAQGIVMQFGDPRRVIQEPGLNVKVPFVQNVVMYDKRILNLDPPTEEVILADKKRINVDSYARYRIVDPLQFYQRVRTETTFRDSFGAIMNSSVRATLGQRSLPDLLSERRDNIMATIQNGVKEAAQDFGVEIVDVRIGRTDLPEDISKNVYDRMRSEREREANLLRAEGDEIKQKIVANADRQKVVILAEADRTAQILRGEGDAERTRILNDAYGTDVAFFRFYRSLDALSAGIGQGTDMVLGGDSDLLRILRELSENDPGQ